MRRDALRPHIGWREEEMLHRKVDIYIPIYDWFSTWSSSRIKETFWFFFIRCYLEHLFQPLHPLVCSCVAWNYMLRRPFRRSERSTPGPGVRWTWTCPASLSHRSEDLLVRAEWSKKMIKRSFSFRNRFQVRMIAITELFKMKPANQFTCLNFSSIHGFLHFIKHANTACVNATNSCFQTLATF